MKALFLFCAFTITAYARLGETPAEIEKRFGKPERILSWVEIQRLDPNYKLTPKEAASTYVFEDIHILVRFLNNRSVFEKYDFSGYKNGKLEAIETKILDLTSNGAPWSLEFTKKTETGADFDWGKKYIKERGLYLSAKSAAYENTERYAIEYDAFYKAKGLIATAVIFQREVFLVVETDEFRALRLPKPIIEIPAVNPAQTDTERKGPLAGFAKDMPAVKPAQTVAEAQKQAIAKYPEIARQGSPLHDKFISLFNDSKQKTPELFSNPNWPMILAEKAAALASPKPAPEAPILANQATSPAAPKAAPEAPRAGIFEEMKSPFEPQLKDTEAAFKDFIAKGHPKPRDQFETREEYEARLPKPFDNTEVFYFEVTNNASFSYDIDKQRLTLVGGEFKKPRYEKYDLTGLVPLLISKKYEDKGKYEASNSYGKTVTVQKTYVNDYYLHLSNGKSLPASLKASDKNSFSDTIEKLALSISMPRDQAKEGAPLLCLVCGVRLLAYAKSVQECTLAGKATISNPSELAVFANGIDAQIVSVHIINKQSKEELARWKQ